MADVDQIVAAIEADPELKEAVQTKVEEITALSDAALEEGAELGKEDPMLGEKVAELDLLIESMGEDLTPDELATIAGKIGLRSGEIGPKTQEHIKAAAERHNKKDHKGEEKGHEGKGGKGGHSGGGHSAGEHPDAVPFGLELLGGGVGGGDTVPSELVAPTVPTKAPPAKAPAGKDFGPAA